MYSSLARDLFVGANLAVRDLPAKIFCQPNARSNPVNVANNGNA
jgi:hypothetical protein